MTKYMGNTFIPQNLAKIEANKPNYRSKVVPPKKGKKSPYKRKRLSKNNLESRFFIFRCI